MTGKIKNERKKKKQQNILFRILFLLALAVFLYAAVRLILYGITYWKGSHEYKGLQKYVSEQPKDEISTEENGEFTVDFSGLKELNPDCIGWLCIPGTQIDYPVMFTPEEPQRYLRRSFYVAYSQSGVPFLDYRCDENSNLILYGHNMRNGTMFGNLTGYTDANFAAEHPVIELQTAAGLSRYTVFAVAAVQKTDPWYDFIEASSSAGFDEQVADLLCKACYKTGIIPAYGQQLLTLSTCYGGGNGRLIVAAVKT